MSPLCHKTFFQDHGLKNTLPRDVVWHLFDKTKKPVTIEWIYEKVIEKHPKINRSTVYRVVHQFINHGLVRSLKLEHDKKEYFEQAQEHSHHFICVQCHTMIRLTECPLDQYEKNISEEHQLEILDHHLHLYGYCQKCKLKNHR